MAEPAQPREHLPKAEDFLLWPPALQVYGYRIVDKLFATRTIERGSEPAKWLRGPEIDVHYRVDDKVLSLGDFMDRNQVAGVLVIKDGRIVLERYGLGLKESDRWSTMSTVKSMTAMLVGAAVKDGAISSIDNNVTKYLSQMKGSVYENVSVRNLMTMSSGVRWSEVYNDKNSDVNRYSKLLADKVPGGVFKMMRELAAERTPGTVWHYNTGDTFLLGALVSAATGKTLARYMSEKIWKPCGMEFDAFYTLETDNGQEIGGSRAGMALRDFGRFAQFVLDGGRCGNRQILREGWVEEAARQAFALPDLWQEMTGGLVGYGYNWWLDDQGAMSAQGHAGQRIYVNRKEKLAIVTLSAFTQPPYKASVEPDREREVRSFTEGVRASF
jgi:CubicO group peptidase (beta-lactamase class C family)